MLAASLGLVLLLSQAPAQPSGRPDGAEDDPAFPQIEDIEDSNDTAEGESPRYGISADFDWSFSNAEKSPLNLTYYGENVMKLLRVSLLFNFRASDRVGLYVNITSENLDTPHLYGAFVRLAPLTENRLWIQAGKIPQPFGAFPERWYPFANPLIGNPFMYSYVTSLRPDNMPPRCWASANARLVTICASITSNCPDSRRRDLAISPLSCFPQNLCSSCGKAVDRGPQTRESVVFGAFCTILEQRFICLLMGKSHIS